MAGEGLHTEQGGARGVSSARATPYRSSKSHVSAGLLAIFLGALGMHKFYLGYFRMGFLTMAITVLGSLLTFGVAALAMCFVGIAEGVVYLATSPEDFQRDYVEQERPWF